ncbi:nucleotidyltransferase domain-containing protein [Devosia limi]|uniref:Nucleotidyltransferase domain-containing protein n=2 Tax=Devosia limi DSM 17137 TaxID=1121477 RepID=A0A1M5BCF0_9HYPH|nr:nucleotidyltransferase domain-containing protein [Devosia limi]SHF40108.1 Nucleotidyltransferase domain-containing protein [Devosia limi DSM 17137]
MPTNLETAIATMAGVFGREPKVRALYLSGSFGYGLADRYSDIDLLIVTEDGPSDEIAALCRRAISAAGDIVLWWDRSVRPTLINAITDDWLRVDVEMATSTQLAGRPQNALKVIFDHDGLYDTLPDQVAPPRPDPKFFRWQVEEFIRILGLMPLALGRQEYVIGLTGVFMLRAALIDLLIAEAALPHRGGMLHLNRQITAAQKTLLASMPALEPKAEAVQHAQLAYAAAFLPRARVMARNIGAEWPERFEAATWANLASKLGIARPY